MDEARFEYYEGLDPAQSASLNIVEMKGKTVSHDYGRTLIYGRNITIRNVTVYLPDNRYDDLNNDSARLTCLNYDYHFNNFREIICCQKLTVDNVNTAKPASRFAIRAIQPLDYIKSNVKGASTVVDFAQGGYNQIISINNVDNFISETEMGNVNRMLLTYNRPYDTAGPEYLADPRSIRPTAHITNCRGVTVSAGAHMHITISDSLVHGVSPLAFDGSVRAANEMICKTSNSTIALRSLDNTGNSFAKPRDCLCNGCDFMPSKLLNGNETSVAIQHVFRRGNRKREGALFTQENPGVFNGHGDKTVTGTPVSSVTPEFVGQEYLQTDGPNLLFKSTGLTTADWIQLN